MWKTVTYMAGRNIWNCGNGGGNGKQFFIKKKQTSYDLAVPLLDIYPRAAKDVCPPKDCA